MSIKQWRNEEMEMKKFRVKGVFKAGRNWEHFSKKLVSNNEKNAAEKLYSLIGSEHGLKRNLIRIETVESLEK
jgi:large subunit ribosomal protein LX